MRCAIVLSVFLIPFLVMLAISTALWYYDSQPMLFNYGELLSYILGLSCCGVLFVTAVHLPRIVKEKLFGMPFLTITETYIKKGDATSIVVGRAYIYYKDVREIRLIYAEPHDIRNSEWECFDSSKDGRIVYSEIESFAALGMGYFDKFLSHWFLKIEYKSKRKGVEWILADGLDMSPQEILNMLKELISE